MSGMKKLLSTGLLALLTTAYLTSSCSRDDFSGSIIEAKKQAFSDNFKAAYGNINPLQDWGFGSATTRAFTRAITVHGDPYDEFNFPTDDELDKAFPSAPPTGSVEVSNLLTYFDGQTYNNGYGDVALNSLYTIFQYGITKDFNLQVTAPGEVELGAGYMNLKDGEYQCYNVYVNLPNKTDVLTVKRNGDTHFNLIVIRGTVNLESDFGAMVGSVCVGSNAVLNDDRTNSGSGKNGHAVKYFCRGEYNATNTEGFDLGNDSRFYNEGTFTVTGPLSYSPGAGNTSYLINFGSGEMTAPSMTMNSTCHFYTAGQVNIDGLTKVTQSGIVWINDGHYTTGSMEFGAGNATFYNYCQLKVTGNCKFRDGAFNMMNSSYAEFGTIQVNNFHVNLYNNSGFNVLNGGKFGQNGAGINQGFFAVNNASAYIRLDGNVYIPRHKNYSFQVSGANLTLAYSSDLKFYETVTLPSGNDICAHDYDDITYSTETTEDLPEMHLWNLNDVTKLVTGDDFGQVTVTPKTYPECGATWNIPGGGGGGDDTTETRVVLKECGRIFCEDLGNVSNKDMDYNDVVFDAWIYVKQTLVNDVVTSESHYRTFIQLLAAGGTLPINVGNLGDVHTIFGAGENDMVNTYVAGYSEVREELCVEKALPDELVIRNELDEFYAREGGVCLKNIPIFVKQGSEVDELDADMGDAPHKFCAAIGTKWVGERIEIGSAYTGFTGWVSKNIEPWSTGVNNLLYDFDYTPSTAHDDTMEYDPNDDPSTTSGSTSGTGGSSGGSTTGGTSFNNVTGTVVYQTQTQLSSGTGITISSSEFHDAAAADIYIYGTGTGNVEVNGAPAEDVSSTSAAPSFNFTRGFGFTRSAETPVVKKCTLGPKQFHGNDIGIRGNNFTVYKVSYNVTLPATLSSISQPTGTVLVSNANGIEMDWAQKGQQHISADELSGIGEGTIIRVAGVGYADNNTDAAENTSWQVELDIENPWTKIGAKTYWTEDNATGAVTVAFVLTADQAEALLNSKLCVQGVNFILKYVTVDNSKVTTGGDDNDGITGKTAYPLWNNADAAWSTTVTATATDLPTLSAGNVLRIKGQIYDEGYGWSLSLVGYDWSCIDLGLGWPDQVNQVTGCKFGKDKGGNLWDRTAGYIDITLTDTLASFFQTHGIRIQTDWLKVTEVTLYQ